MSVLDPPSSSSLRIVFNFFDFFSFFEIQEDANIPFEFYPVSAFEQTFIGLGSRQKNWSNWELSQRGGVSQPISRFFVGR